LSCAGGQTTMKMGDTVEIKGDEIKLFSKDASIVLDDDANMDGKMVKLNCDPTRPALDNENDGPPETGTITFRADPKFKSEDGVPLTLVIATPTGETIERTADAAGEVKIEGKKGDHFVLIDVRKGTQSLTKKPS
jgi:hypothetical protein